jgi:2-polyprenyl-3-methyl-5-hydroxy-6-metoxy-1,4-benzoquinol methylase
MNIQEMAVEQPERRIHMERYEYAAAALIGKRVLDCACGMGYGTAILGMTGRATGVDIDPAAIELAKAEYPKCDFAVGDIYSCPKDEYEAFVSFETLEHLDRPQDVLANLPISIADIVVSAPIRPTVGWNPWHRSDFTHGSFCSLVEAAGFRIVHAMGQPWVDGKGDLYLMVHGRRGAWTL